METSKNSYINKPISLGSIVSINPESIGKVYENSKIDYIDISSVGSGILNGTTVYEISKAPSRAKRLISHGDTILSTVRPNRRSFLFIKNPSHRIVVSTGFAVLRPTEKIDPRFLYYTVTNQPFTDYLTANAKGAAYPAVDTEIIARADINLPPLPTQRKIAAILSAYDDLIENNTRRIKILEEMAQALYREWFVKFRFPGHEKVKMMESELGLVPEGWEVKPIGEVIETIGGGTPSTKIPEYWENGDIIWFTPSDLTASGTMFISESSKRITQSGFENNSARLFPPYSVMMTSRATIGVTAINMKEACTNQGFITCIPNENLSTYQIYFWIDQNKDKIITIASGATYKEINRTEFRQFLITVPNRNINKNYVQITTPIAKQIENLQVKNANLRRTRDLLLPKLISGEVDVEKIDVRMADNST